MVTVLLQWSIIGSVGLTSGSISGPPAANQMSRLLFSTSTAAAFLSRRLESRGSPLTYGDACVTERVLFLCNAPVEFCFNFESGSGAILMQLQAAADETAADHFDFLRLVLICGYALSCGRFLCFEQRPNY